MKLLAKFYKLLTEFKHYFLISNLGFTTYCRHKPSCSQYCVKQIKENGLVGAFRGLKRILTCCKIS